MGGRILKLAKSTQAALEQQNHTIAEMQNEMRANQNSQAQSNSNMGKMIGQLASLVHYLIVSIEKGKFSS